MLTNIEKHISMPLLLEEKFPVSIMDKKGVILYVNDLFCKQSSYEKYELLGQSIEMLAIEDEFHLLVQEIESTFQTNTIFQRKIQRKNKQNNSYWIDATFIPIIEYGRLKSLISFEIDITQEVVFQEKYSETLTELKNIKNALDESAVVAITNRRGTITYVNEKFCELSKYSSDELIGQKHSIVNSNFHPRTFFKDMWRTIGTGRIWTGDIKNKAKDGSEYWVSTTIVPFLDHNQKPFQYISIRTDITNRKNAEEALQIALKNDFQQTVKNLQNAIFKYQKDENKLLQFTLLEGRLVEKLGITIQSFQTGTFFEKLSIAERIYYSRYLHKALDGEAVHFEFEYLNYTFLIYLSPILEDGSIIEVVGTISDITERKIAERQVERMAYYDFLTGLPNRRLLEYEIQEAITDSKRHHKQFAVLFMDLDRFKHINDSMGHATGDELLKYVGKRLTNIVRKTDTVARLGGDEFVILLPNTTSSEAEIVATKIINSLREPIIFKNIDIFVNSSLGISMYPTDGETTEDLIRNADIAMYESKNDRVNTFYFFTEELHEEMAEKTKLRRDLHHALKNKELELYYQPQINLKTQRISGVEALLRWHHPDKGMVSPVKFIPIAEETGLIISIGYWILDTACIQIKKWQEAGYPSIQMSINVSPRQFRQPSFIHQVQEVLDKHQIEPELLNLEITESMMSDVHHCKMTLKKLRAIGVHVSVDDFGTGYSSLSYLNDFPLTHLKIDQAFVQNSTKNNQAIVKTIIDLANNLNLDIVAEGVETSEQAAFLKSLCCNHAQGYLYAKPLPIQEVELLFSQTFHTE